jgi:hypothetical protein
MGATAPSDLSLPAPSLLVSLSAVMLIALLVLNRGLWSFVLWVAWLAQSTVWLSFFSNFLAVTNTIAKIERLNLILIGTGALAGTVTGGMHVPSFLLGGGIMHVNFWLLKKVVQVVVRPQRGRGGKGRAILWFAAKGMLLLLLSSALFIRYPVHAESFTVGVSLLLVACVIVSLSH